MGRAGFTLIELAVVVVLIGILSAVTVQGMRTSGERSNNTKMEGIVRQVALAVEAYAAEHDGVYPTTLHAVGFIDKGYIKGNHLPVVPWAKTPQTVDCAAIYPGGTDNWSELKIAARGHTIPDAWGAGGKAIANHNPPYTWDSAGFLRYNTRAGSNGRVYEMFTQGRLNNERVVLSPVSNALD